MGLRPQLDRKAKMSATLSRLVLWLFVINLGIVFGAGLYEHRIVVPRWIESPGGVDARWNADAARQDDTGRRFWALVSTVPLTLLTLVNLWAGWRAEGPLRVWWLAASGAALADRVFTFAYFIPTMIGLMGAPGSPESVAIASRWWNLNYLRHVIVFAAWLAALKTFALFHQPIEKR
jgi:hypothetical protein